MRRRNDRLLKGPLAVGLFVLALAIQNFIVQQHVHGAASGGAAASTSAPAKTADAPP